jgi:hypothetical protein
MRAGNQKMAQRLTRSTCAGGVPNSGERDCAFPVAEVLGSSSGKLHGLLGKLPRAWIERRRAGNGSATMVVFGRLWRVAERSPELWASSGELGAGQGMQRGRWLGTGAGFIAVARAWSRAAAEARGFAHGRALSPPPPPPSVSPRRTRVCLLLPWFNSRLEHLSVQILAKPLCTVSSLHHILPFLCESQAKIRSG